jgi:hypothetical protein
MRAPRGVRPGRGMRPERTAEYMRNSALIIIGLAVTVAGAIFALQGFGVIGGSAMSGSSLWSVLGPLIALCGLVLTGAGLRRGRVAPR